MTMKKTKEIGKKETQTFRPQLRIIAAAKADNKMVSIGQLSQLQQSLFVTGKLLLLFRGVIPYSLITKAPEYLKQANLLSYEDLTFPFKGCLKQFYYYRSKTS